MPMTLESNQNHAVAKETEIAPGLTASMGEGGGHIPMVVEPIIFKDDITIKIDGEGKAFTIGSRDYKGAQCVSYQIVSGTINPGGHPGSYNGQNAYNEMLVTEDGLLHRERTIRPAETVAESWRAELYARSADNFGEGGQMKYSIENHPNDGRVSIREDETVQTLSGRMGTGGNNTPMCMETYRKEAHPRTADEGQGWTTTTTTDTLNSFDNTENRTPTLAASEYAVRRLTPEECEILQGYPVGWTDIGEWVDSKGKVRQTVDSARYKALGNSICLPPWKWVLKRICAQYERDATMGSLFDGIGGFPYLWEQLNYPGSCLWASEIEEFPIAVTERRINGKRNDSSESDTR